MTAEERAKAVWRSNANIAKIAAAIRTAEADAYRRGQEAFRVRVLLCLTRTEENRTRIRALPVEEPDVR